jgi:hypothetical protein
MNFAYDGFTHQEDRRCFLFRSIDGHEPVDMFSIEVDMSLLVENRVPMQEGPMLCLQLLKTASAAGPIFLERFHKCRIFAEDLRPFLVERAKSAADKALRTLHHRPSYRKPPPTSNIRLGAAKEN